MKLVPLVAGRIGHHEGKVPGHCPWIGTRVVDDYADFVSEEAKPGARS
ncbi:hypothetical protein ACIA8C_39240 [Nocardia sp. NPDC051321]